jgi:rsbT co-antagonist protein RsbR
MADRDTDSFDGEALEGLLRARRILDTSPTFVVAMDTSGRIVDMNRTMLAALGYTLEEVVGREYAPMFVPAEEQAALREVMAAVVSDGAAGAGENHVLARDGRKVLVEWHGGMLRDAAGQIQHSYAVGIEVGERQRIRSALRRSEQRLALHFDQAPIAMIEWDTEFRIIDWNPAAERIFGYSREEILGKHGLDLIVPESVRPVVDQICAQMLEGRKNLGNANENVTRDGRLIMCEWNNTSLVDEDGKVVGVASLVSDVTERHRAEEELRQRERAQAETIEQLSAPIIDVWEGVLALPVIGAIDKARAERMTQSLLEAIVQSGASHTIVDLTGSTAMDAATAAHLGGMVRAAGLLGTVCLVSGLSPAMARTLVELDTDLGVRTFGTLRAALRHAIEASRARRAR